MKWSTEQRTESTIPTQYYESNLVMSVTVPLPDLNVTQIDKVLEKLQLISPKAYDEAGRLELLRCSRIFKRHFNGYENDKISAVFDKKSNFVDFVSDDGQIDGIFVKGDSTRRYPCRVCAAEVTDNEDDSGFGLECNGCGNYFHNSCVSESNSKLHF